MMTIKQFASLCGCNTQTLRYYDKIDLLKPVKVDPWSGYRYYTESQALEFVKIKNLQAADFSIGEIKQLLILPDQQVYEAFSLKIGEQEAKLSRIREIQQSYLAEMNTMKKLIDTFCTYLREETHDQDLLREFGLESADAPRLVDAIHKFMLRGVDNHPGDEDTVTLVVNDQLFQGEEALENLTCILRREELSGTVELNESHIRREEATFENYARVWEAQGWNHVHEFLDEIPVLESGRNYCFHFLLNDQSNRGNLSFPMFMIGAMLLRGYDREITMSCTVESSKDGTNRFALFREK